MHSWHQQPIFRLTTVCSSGWLAQIAITMAKELDSIMTSDNKLRRIRQKRTPQLMLRRKSDKAFSRPSKCKKYETEKWLEKFPASNKYLAHKLHRRKLLCEQSFCGFTQLLQIAFAAQLGK